MSAGTDTDTPQAMIPARQFLRQCKSAGNRMKVADSSGTTLTGRRLLTASLIFRNLLSGLLGSNERMVGLLLPPSAGGAIANTAVSLLGRVAVNLNYTLSEDVLNYCIRECELKHVLTSRRFIEQRPFELDAEFVFLEDLKEQATTLQKITALMHALFTPATMLERKLGLTKIDPDDLLTVIFTSGSTGEPKGVMLSHNNVLSNIIAVDELFHLTSEDVLLGILPFFHSFGYTVTLWLPLCIEPAVAYHFNPLDGRTVGKIAGKYNGTILAATPTFLRTYLKRCTTEQFAKLNLVIVGAEKMPADLAAAFKDKFGVEPTEGYGTTELSPVAAFNVPDDRTPQGQAGTRMGTVGRVMPGAEAAIVDADTGESLGTNAEGLLRIRGSNVMLGYLNKPEKTQEVILDGWYDTGDMARIDDDGFIEITGRLSRFSKIGGEMVPHVRVEEELVRIVEGDHDVDDDETEITVAVTSVPDAKKGERLVVVHRPLPKPKDEILSALGQTGLPNIWLPSADSFLEVDEIPLLGTGKLDLKGLKTVALERFGENVS